MNPVSPVIPETARASASRFPGVEAVILAGGRSLRMGRDKARLRSRGRSLLSLSGDAARALGLSVRVIRHDNVPQCGPLGGISTALSRPRAETVLFLSCDMPRVQPGLLKRILARVGPRQHAAFIETEGWVGFPFAIRSSAYPVVRNQWEHRKWSLQALAESLSAARIPVPPREKPQLLNVNTPEAWHAYRASLATSAPHTPRTRPLAAKSRPRPHAEPSRDHARTPALHATPAL